MKLQLFHVCFADDLLLFTREGLESIRHMVSAFKLFSGATGLKDNQTKSSIYFGGVRQEIQDTIRDEFHFAKGELHFCYLGVLLSSKKLTVIQCQPLIKIILAKIDSWPLNLLSYAGRLQLSL